jgi:hypothetical protein
MDNMEERKWKREILQKLETIKLSNGARALARRILSQVPEAGAGQLVAQADFDQARRDLQQQIGLTPSGSRTQPASRDAATNDSLPLHAAARHLEAPTPGPFFDPVAFDNAVVQRGILKNRGLLPTHHRSPPAGTSWDEMDRDEMLSKAVLTDRLPFALVKKARMLDKDLLKEALKQADPKQAVQALINKQSSGGRGRKYSKKRKIKSKKKRNTRRKKYN